jgi:Tol biopolymer transport system component
VAARHRYVAFTRAKRTGHSHDSAPDGEWVHTGQVRLRVSPHTALVLCAASACGRLDFTAIPDAGASLDDGTAVPDALALGPWGTPQPLTSLNTTMDESDPELRADGREIVFHSLRAGGLGKYDLYRAERLTTDAPFDAPVPLSSLNTISDDMGPGLSGDGLTIIFGDGQDIVFATRPTLTSPFGARQPLAALSSTDIDTAPELSGDGKIAVVVRGVGDPREMWIYERAADGPVDTGWSAGRQLVELSSPVTESSPDLDAKGLVIYFHSDRAGTGGDDLYIATRETTSDPFGAPTPITEINVPGIDDGDPSVSANGRVLVFHRQLDLFQSTR